MQMLIGNAEYHCSCVRYVWSRDNMALIVGLTVALVLLVYVIIVIIIVVALKNRRRTQAAERQTDLQSDDHKDKDINTHLPDDGTAATSL